MAHTLIDEASTLTSLLDSLNDLPHSPPSLFIDLEGDNLSRHGTISILQLYVQPQSHVYLIDVHKLAAKAFDTAGSNGQTLRSILESPTISKVFFDVRNDSDALFNLFHVSLANADDLQLMELATRTFAKRHVNGLKRCIEEDAPMAATEKQKWIKTKQEGQRLFDPKFGGSYAVFNDRPLSEAIQSYCIQDVFYLPGLWTLYSRRLSNKKWVVVRDATQARIKASQGLRFNGKGQHMALSPWPGWPTTPDPQKSSPQNSDDTKHQEIPVRVDDRPQFLPPESPSDGSAAQNQMSQHRDDPGNRSRGFANDTDHGEGSRLVLDISALSLTAFPNKVTKPETLRVEQGNSDLVPTDGNVQKKPETELTESISPWPSPDAFDDHCDYFDGFDDLKSPTDYTACSADDCGYCGHCSY